MVVEAKVSIIQVIEGLNKRLEKAKELVRDDKVRKVQGADSWLVENKEKNKIYLVQDSSCTCLDFQQRKDLHKGWCKHRLAVALVGQERNEGEQK